jgi:hypothetical protein
VVKDHWTVQCCHVSSSLAKDKPGLLETNDKAINFVLSVVEVEAGAGGGLDAESMV